MAMDIDQLVAKIVGEDFESVDENKYGKFNVSMYGARGAALN